MNATLRRALDTALGATMTRNELNRFTGLELGRRYTFFDNVKEDTYPNQRAEYIAYLERRGKLKEFIEVFLAEMEDNQREEITALREALVVAGTPEENEPEKPSPAPAVSPPPLSPQTIAEVHKLVGNNRIPQALKVLEAAAGQNPELFGAVTTLKGQLHQLERDGIMGTLSFEQTSVQRARIVNGILGLLH